VTGRRVLVATLLALATATTAAGCRGQQVGPITLRIMIHYSRFEPSQLTAPHGVPITFELVNEDPIGHEWLIGDAPFHARHRHGTEVQHGARPNEISLPPLGTVETTLTFSTPGQILYICHLPGHEAYGMVGTLTVT
jgi:uncharacterized cupredoxin-like copper-binding protein